MSEVRIRALEPAELRALVPALSNVLADCVEGGASVSFMSPYSRDDASVFWNRIADTAERGDVSVLVAEVDGQVSGTVQIGFDMPPNQPHRGEIRKLLVHRGARGKGLGKELMRAAEQEALARGKSLLCLDTASGAAVHIYESLGWKRVGTIPDFALLPDGGYCDTTIFYKRLA